MATKVQAGIPVTITISLVDMKCTHFLLTSYAIENKNPIDFNGGYEFTFSLNIRIVENEKKAVINVESKLFEKQSDNRRMELAEVKMTTVFAVINYDELIKKDTQKELLQIPNQLIELCNNLCIHSLRGVYCAKLENTLYSNAILPLMHPKQFGPNINQPLT